MKVLVVALIVPAIVLGVAAFETQILGTPSSNGPAEGIVWHGRTFVSHADFARWLRSRGSSYAAWARSHPSLAGVRAGRSEQAGHNNSDWLVRAAVGFGILAGLGLAAAFVGRRWPGSRDWAKQMSRLAARQAAAAAREGTRLLLLGAEATALLSWRTAKIAAKITRSRGAPAAKQGARVMLRWARATALLSWSKARSLTGIVRSRGGPEFGDVLAHRAAPAGKRRARLMVDWGAALALPSASLALPLADTIRRRRGELAWYLFTTLIAVGVGVVATVWLNGA
jgi:hypothetical protein